MKTTHLAFLVATLLTVGAAGGASATCIGALSDNFEDGALGPRWVVTSLPCGSVTETGGRLVLQRGACTGTVAVEMIGLNEEICGDFDIWVDYTLAGFGIPSNGSMWASMLLYESAGPGYVALERYNRFAAGDCAPNAQDYKMFVNTTANCSSYLEATTDQTGALRIRRTGSTVEFYRWAGAWVLMTTRVFNANAVRLRFYTGSDVNTASWTFSLDNLSILSVPVAVASNAPPAESGILRAMPSPFREQTTLEYSLAESGPIDLAIHSADGRRVRTLTSADQASTLRRVVWDGRDDEGRRVSSGVYFVRLAVGSATLMRKVVLER
jgi:hypothetical protein